MELSDQTTDWPATPITKCGKRTKFKDPAIHIQAKCFIQTNEDSMDSIPIKSSADLEPPAVRRTTTAVEGLNESEKENNMFQFWSDTSDSYGNPSATSSPIRSLNSSTRFERCHPGRELCPSGPMFEVEQLAEMLKSVSSDNGVSNYLEQLNIVSPTEPGQETMAEYELTYASSNSSVSNFSDEEDSSIPLKNICQLGVCKRSRIRVSFRPMKLDTVKPPNRALQLERPGTNESRLVIIDCRYPYEYRGGHIHGAINLAEWPKLRRFLFGDHSGYYTNDSISSYPRSSKTIFIMHCEFSSERAPKLFHLLRNHDRAVHINSYPALRYPKIYLLRGGYAAFFRNHPELCEPSAYVKMHSVPHLLSSWNRHCALVNRRSSVSNEYMTETVRTPLFSLAVQSSSAIR